MKALLDQTPAPPGWFAYYYRPGETEIWALPVALWVLVEDSTPTSATVEYRAHVVGRLGQVIDYAAYDGTLLCLLPPGIDHGYFVRQFLPEDMRATAVLPAMLN